jgi:hypothetical protein
MRFHFAKAFGEKSRQHLLRHANHEHSYFFVAGRLYAFTLPCIYVDAVEGEREYLSFNWLGYKAMH